MDLKILVVLGFVSAIAADSPPSYRPPERSMKSSMENSEEHPTAAYRGLQSEENSAEYGLAKYDFSYTVKDDYSSNDFGHQETRDGDLTEGLYYVQLPDGRLQTVKYFVDGNSGYVAEVTYEGEARYPESNEIRRYEASGIDYSSSESMESGETVAAVVFTRRYFSPQTDKSQETSVGNSHRRRYFAPDSQESKESSVVVIPRVRYSTPDSQESKETFAVVTPRAHYFTSDSRESKEDSIIVTPRPRYSTSDSQESKEYSVPVTPRPRYSAPDFQESAETPTIAPLQTRYSFPDSQGSSETMAVSSRRRYSNPESEESQETVTVTSPRPSNFAPKSEGSQEGYVYPPPPQRPFYFAQDNESQESSASMSGESHERPKVSTPRRLYSAP